MSEALETESDVVYAWNGNEMLFVKRTRAFLFYLLIGRLSAKEPETFHMAETSLNKEHFKCFSIVVLARRINKFERDVYNNIKPLQICR